MKIMGLDVGQVRIGIAISDTTETIAQSRGLIKRTNIKDDIKSIKTTAEENDVGLIVIGLPLNMDGSCGKQAEVVLELKDSIAQEVDLPIETYDERLTSKQAESVLIEGDISRKKRKGKIDTLAAVLILQGFLDSRKQ
jgi:putative Holliday junction resolvase